MNNKYNYKKIKNHSLRKFQACDYINREKTNFYFMKQHCNEYVFFFLFLIHEYTSEDGIPIFSL
jgi:hypothetical protein